MRRELLVLALLCLGILSARAAPAIDGAALYAGRCAACHEHAHDRIPPRYILNRLWPDQVERALTSGPMRQQAAGLSKDEINAVIFYLTRKQAGGAAPDPKANH